MSPTTMRKVFKLRDTPCYNLRRVSQFSTDLIHSLYNGTESVSYLGPTIWEQIPAEIKNKESLEGFEKSKNGNQLNVHVEFVGHLYLIYVLSNKE